MDYTTRYCIVGAGASGLAVAKNLKQAGIAFDVFEREDDVGGNWYYGKPNSSVCRSTHLISSKPLTEYTDFPMPEEYPPYLSHWQVHEYLKGYAHHFGLYELITFNTSVERISSVPSFGFRTGGEGSGVRESAPLWEVTLGTGETRRYGGIIIANGHLWDPKYPNYPGEFNGLALHSKHYKTADVLRDKRALIVGAGNSGCDIAVESAQNAAKTFLSVRRGYYYNPKFIFGMPSDQFNEIFLKMRTPLPLYRAAAKLILKFTIGLPQDYGLPKPDHELLESHPIVNSQLFYTIGHGDITPKPDVQELRGDRVLFKDGSEEAIDVIVYATGFNVSFPFIDKQYLNWQDGRPRLYLNVFHPRYDNLFIVGLIQPDSGTFGLMDYQAQLVARFTCAQRSNAHEAAVFRKLKASGQPFHRRGFHYVDSTRHYFELEHFSYRNRLRKLIRRFV